MFTNKSSLTLSSGSFNKTVYKIKEGEMGRACGTNLNH
jgi:hypothetical protein